MGTESPTSRVTWNVTVVQEPPGGGASCLSFLRVKAPEGRGGTTLPPPSSPLQLPAVRVRGCPGAPGFTTTWSAPGQDVKTEKQGNPGISADATHREGRGGQSGVSLPCVLEKTTTHLGPPHGAACSSLPTLKVL